MSVSYRERGRKNRSGIYLVLAVILIIVMFKWGIPFFINALAGPSTGATPKLNQTDDNIPPQVPLLSALPEATNSAMVTVEGFTEPDVSLTLSDNDSLIDSTQSDKDGKFSFNITLKSGDNNLLVKAKDKAGNESQSSLKKVVFDDKALNIKVDSPKDGDEFFGTKNQNVTITGKIDKPNSSMTVNNSFVRVSADGSFSTSYKLSGGDNTLTFIATDQAGNQGQLVLKLKLTL